MRRESGELIKHQKEKGNGAENVRARINGVGLAGAEGLFLSNWGLGGVSLGMRRGSIGVYKAQGNEGVRFAFERPLPADGEKTGTGTKAEALAQGKGRAWPRSLVFSSS